jgi:hypothetical protein
MTRNRLSPCSAVTRWTALRRYEVLTDVRLGRTTPGVHGISEGEFGMWDASFDLTGLRGLSAGALAGFARNLRAGVLA